MSLAIEIRALRIVYAGRRTCGGPVTALHELSLDVPAGAVFGLSRTECRRRGAQLLLQFGLADAADRRIGGYSRGMKQRLGLAQALINDPELLIWDEPTSGMDPLGRRDLRRCLADLKARGKTVFFSSHELSEVELACDRIAILARGRLAACGRPAELLRPGERLEQLFLRSVGEAPEAGA